MTRFRSIFLALAVLASLPAAAQAATVTASKSCYAKGKPVRIDGEGFAPESPVSFTVNRRQVAADVVTDEDGAFTANYTPPTARTESRLVIEVTDSESTSAATTIHVTRKLAIKADPRKTDNVLTWKAVFRLFGFGRGHAYIHYVAPNGHPKKTVDLGKLKGPCGRLKTSRRRVLPFRDPAFGIWHLQFDTHRKRRASTRNKRVIPVRVYRG